ncbi:MAG TPA: sensor histidine kinase [Candidatus Sulfotelmatobacter sp.]|nr:sensor histidine kinase [Candidatus Sulfotelmatobacter sp.]
MSIGAALSARTSRNGLLRYILAIGVPVIPLLACRWLNPFVGDDVTYIVLIPVVVFVAWYCGVVPSLVTIVLVMGGVMYWPIPKHPIPVPGLLQSVSALAFLFTSMFIVALGEARRRDNEKLRNTHGELENRVQERTAELDVANQKLRRLTTRLLELQDEERRRIARELHDSIGQMLAALSMNLSGVRADIDHLKQTTATLTDSEDLVQEMCKEVRTISHLLHPPLLDEAGLSSALGWYVDGFAQRSKIGVELDCPDNFGRIPREMETAVFRLVQECLTNIHRHSGSVTAKIRLHRTNHEVVVEVEDAGKGIPSEKLDRMSSVAMPGVGITGMKERVRQLGGTLEISSGRTGTRIVARVPISETSPKEDLSSSPETSSPAAA